MAFDNSRVTGFAIFFSVFMEFYHVSIWFLVVSCSLMNIWK